MQDDISDVSHGVVSAIAASRIRANSCVNSKLVKDLTAQKSLKCPVSEIGRDDTVGESYKRCPDPVRRMKDGDSGSLISKLPDLGNCQSSKEIWTS